MADLDVVEGGSPLDRQPNSEAEPGKDAEVPMTADSSPSQGASLNKPAAQHYKKLMGAGLVALTLLTFASALSSGFVHDDVFVVKKNPLEGRWDAATLKSVFTRDLWAALRPEGSGEKLESIYYRPVFSVFVMAGLVIARHSELRWHVIAVLVHVIATLLVFYVLERSLSALDTLQAKQRALIAALGAAVFAVHPLQSESVAWVSAVSTTLNTVFMLASFACYLRLRQTEHREPILTRVILILSGSCLFLLGALTKESTLALLLVVAAYELFVFNRNAGALARVRMAALSLGPFLLATAAYLGLRYNALRVWWIQSPNLNFPEDSALTLIDNLRTLPLLLASYMKLAVFPSGLSMLYDLGYVRTLGAASFWLPLLIVALVGGLLFYFARKDLVARLGLIWIAIPLLPNLNTRAFVSDEIIHDRYMYLSLAGCGLLTAAALTHLARSERISIGRSAVPWIAGVLLAALATMTMAQNRFWLNDSVVWSHSAERAPNSRTAHLALGLRAETRQDLDGALREYETALQINPDIIDALNNAAFVYAHQGKWPLAARNFERIVALTPDKAVAHFNLSVAYAAQARSADARYELSTAIQLNPSGKQSDEWRAQLMQLDSMIKPASPARAGQN